MECSVDDRLIYFYRRGRGGHSGAGRGAGSGAGHVGDQHGRIGLRGGSSRFASAHAQLHRSGVGGQSARVQRLQRHHGRLRPRQPLQTRVFLRPLPLEFINTTFYQLSIHFFITS